MLLELNALEVVDIGLEDKLQEERPASQGKPGTDESLDASAAIVYTIGPSETPALRPAPVLLLASPDVLNVLCLADSPADPEDANEAACECRCSSRLCIRLSSSVAAKATLRESIACRACCWAPSGSTTGLKLDPDTIDPPEEYCFDEVPLFEMLWSPSEARDMALMPFGDMMNES
jgi:hypothetical protein